VALLLVVSSGGLFFRCIDGRWSGDIAVRVGAEAGVKARPQELGIRDLETPCDALDPITKALQANRLFGKKDMQTGDIAFQSAQARLDLADVLAALALGIQHFLNLHEQIQAGIRHLRPLLLRYASKLYARGQPSTTLDPATTIGPSGAENWQRAVALQPLQRILGADND
jgi:hypothetical protein